MEEDDYNDDIDSEDISELVSRARTAEAKNVELSGALNGMANSKKDDNFLHHQLSTEEMLEKLEHFYKGDFQGEDKNRDIVWKKQTNKNLITFNEFGVTSIMEIITKYIDKNTILSYYTSERIYEIMADIGDDLVLFILCNYEKLGMDTYFKKTKFRLIVTTTLHMIESSYRRSIGGKTMMEINQSRVISQFSNLPGQQQEPHARVNPIAKFLGNKG